MVPMRVTLFLIAILAPTAAHAYIGPGAGITAIGSVLALVGALLLAIIGLVWYPLKRVMKGRKKAQAVDQKADDSGSA